MSRLELKIPPLALALLTAAAMWGLGAWTESLSVVIPYGARIALLLAALGAVVIVAGIVSFRAARTTADPRYPGKASSLVVVGIYRYSRNPMYLGMAILLLAWAFYLANGFAALLVVAFVIYMNRFQIGVEERFLNELFGADYVAYMSRVRRWL